MKRDQWSQAAMCGMKISDFCSSSAGIEALRYTSDEQYRSFPAQFDTYVDQLQAQCTALSVLDDFDTMKVIDAHLDAMRTELRALSTELIVRTMPGTALGYARSRSSSVADF
jgi:hypothetical protein